MKNIRDFLSENFQVFEVKFSTYLNRYVFVMVIENQHRWLEGLNIICVSEAPFFEGQTVHMIENWCNIVNFIQP